jgi:hypothetical protein
MFYNESSAALYFAFKKGLEFLFLNGTLPMHSLLMYNTTGACSVVPFLKQSKICQPLIGLEEKKLVKEGPLCNG